MERGVKALDEFQRNRLITAWAKDIKTQLDHLLPNKPGEADLRHCVEPLLDSFCREVGVPPLKHAEYSLFSVDNRLFSATMGRCQ